ncbi:hypothetical protein E2320_002412, partial [Naja naja]
KTHSPGLQLPRSLALFFSATSRDSARLLSF